MTLSLRRPAAPLLSALLLLGCAPAQTPPQTRTHDARTFNAITPNFTAVAGAQLYQGVRPGLQGPASYAVEVPANWNGALVMYAHGYAGDGPDLRVQEPPLRQFWLSQGYAWGASSYSANYYDARAGLEDTNALALAFPTITGKARPSQYLIVGASMGGHVAAAAVEAETANTARNRVSYAASMPVCGVMDEQYEFQWLGDYNLLAAQLAGYGAQTYPDANFQKNLPQILGKLFASTTDPVWQENAAAGTRLRLIAQNLTGGERPVAALGFRLGGYQKAVLTTGGTDGTLNGVLAKNIYGNVGRSYRWTADTTPTPEETAFNAAILRVTADPNANPARPDGLRWLPRVAGQISVPVLTLHTTGDFYVPFRHQQLYRQKVDALGHAGLLVQRAIRAAGHCEFNGQELVQGFTDLVAWQKTGQKPGGDDVLTPGVVADPNYGCAYTRATRPGVAACPAAAPQGVTGSK